MGHCFAYLDYNEDLQKSGQVVLQSGKGCGKIKLKSMVIIQQPHKIIKAQKHRLWFLVFFVSLPPWVSDMLTTYEPRRVQLIPNEFPLKVMSIAITCNINNEDNGKENSDKFTLNSNYPAKGHKRQQKAMAGNFYGISFWKSSPVTRNVQFSQLVVDGGGGYRSWAKCQLVSNI